AWAGGNVPGTTTAVNVIFNNNSSAANLNIPNYIYMPGRLQEATGSTTWTINDNNGGTAPFTSELTLVNQGSIFVNGTPDFTQGSGTINWLLQNLAGGGDEIFENDGAVNIIGVGGNTGQTKAAIAGGRFSITGDGQFNLFGNNASLLIATGVSVG